MKSIRCSHCNLLNFATEPACKKCRQPLGSHVPETVAAGYGVATVGSVNADPAAAYQNYQPPARQSSSYYAPPPPNFYDDLRGGHPAASVQHDYTRTFTISIPPVCVKCGRADDLTMQKFKKDYTPPLAYLGVLIGPIPLLIILLIARKRHKMNGLFCSACWDKFKNHSTITGLINLACLVVLIGGLVIAVTKNAPFLGLFAVLLSIGIGTYAHYFSKKVSPKFTKMNREKIFIKIPNHGDVDFTFSTY